MSRPRVLVVDDSAFARTVLSRVLKASGEIDVVGTARDGDDALAQIEELDPDVVTLDLTMPGRDGLDVLRTLQDKRRPRVIVVSVSTIDSGPAAEALSLGAIDLVSKPTALASDRLYELANELVLKVLAVSMPLGTPPRGSAAALVHVVRAADLVLIGTSTGGPQALTRILTSLPADLGAPVAMVLHIPVGYTQALAERLDRMSRLEVVEAVDGIELRPGRVVLARAGHHLKIRRDSGRLIGRLDALPIGAYTPSVDELFRTGAEATGARTLGIVLTGMGDDGLEGARAIAAAGGMLLTESASSCVVYGMPRVVFEAGLGAREAALERISQEIIDHATHR